MSTQLKILLSFLGVVFLASCTATPQIQVKTLGMNMELRREAYIVQSAAFSPDGRYVLTGSWDSTLKLWDITTGKQIRIFKGHKERVMSVAFSPDGRYALSKGFDGTLLWDVETGKKLRALNKGLSVMYSNVVFSPDGRYAVLAELMSIGLWDVSTGKKIRELETGFFEGGNLTKAAFSPDGRYVLSGGYLNLWDVSTGKKIRTFPTGGRDVAFSPDGRYVLSSTTLTLWDMATGNEIRTFIRHSDEVFSGEVFSGEVFSVAFSPDGKYALSGSKDGTVKLWDISTGMEIRTFKGHSYLVGSVSFSPDGRYALSGSEDASTRIWDVSTGEQVAMMVGFEDGEWIVTTPNGYYNSSPNGDKYLSVKVGGKDYTIEQLRESFYRPDLVKLALAGGSLKEFKKVADIKQPPIVSIVDTPKSVDRDEARVTLKIEDQGGGIGDIRLYLNGSAVVLDSTRGVSIVPTRQDKIVYKTYTVKLTNGLNTIKAMAFNADNTMNSTEVLHEITASFKTLAKPSLYALVIGINEYKNPKLQLNYAVADAGLFADTLQKGAAGLFDKIIIKKLTSPQETTNNNITEELKAMQKQLKPDDLFVFYVASHGTVDDGEYFLITSNVGSTSTEKLKADAIPQNTLKELIANIPATKKLIVIDTCSAGALGDAIQTAMLTRGMSEDTAMKVLSRAVGSTILMASTAVQEALEGYNGHGVFTYIVSEGLNGKADSDKDGFIKTTELANYVDDEVPALAEKVFKKAQYPTVSPSGQAFPVGRVK